MPLLNRNFSHIYVEDGAADYPIAQSIFAKFPKAALIEVGNYKEIFNRKGQDWRLQKESMKLILARKKHGFLYPGSSFTPSFKNLNFYYNTLIMNCLYDCEYCYLQGMYPSANVVVFVNLEDYFQATDSMLAEKGSAYLSISYDTDLMAFENIVPYCSAWLEYARARPNLTVELRTKSANFAALSGKPTENFILAWTLSPATIIEKYEPRTPSLDARLRAARAAIGAGWKVRLCFDPILRVTGWEQDYEQLLAEVFRTLPAEKVHDSSIGTFRMNREYFANLQKLRLSSDILAFPQKNERTIGYGDAPEMIAAFRQQLGNYLPDERIFAL